MKKILLITLVSLLGSASYADIEKVCNGNVVLKNGREICRGMTYLFEANESNARSLCKFRGLELVAFSEKVALVKGPNDSQLFFDISVGKEIGNVNMAYLKIVEQMDYRKTYYAAIERNGHKFISLLTDLECK